MNCIVCEGLLFSSKLLKKSHCRSRPPHCRILPHILHPLIPRHFHLWYHTIRLVANDDNDDIREAREERWRVERKWRWTRNLSAVAIL